MVVNPCITAVHVSWSFGEEIHYFGTVNIQFKNGSCSLTITVHL